MARLLERSRKQPLILFDEFTSELDRANGKAMAATCAK